MNIDYITKDICNLIKPHNVCILKLNKQKKEYNRTIDYSFYLLISKKEYPLDILMNLENKQIIIVSPLESNKKFYNFSTESLNNLRKKLLEHKMYNETIKTTESNTSNIAVVVDSIINIYNKTNFKNQYLIAQLKLKTHDQEIHFLNQLNWNIISQNAHLSYQFIRKFKNYINFDLFSEYQKLNFIDIQNLQNYLNFILIFKNYSITDEIKNEICKYICIPKKEIKSNTTPKFQNLEI